MMMKLWGDISLNFDERKTIVSSFTKSTMLTAHLLNQLCSQLLNSNCYAINVIVMRVTSA